MILFNSTATDFATKGIGTLSDAISASVTEERNGAYELQFQYPVEGIHFGEIGQRSIVLAKPSPQQDEQPFRVYKITKPLNGICTIYAEHISYDLSGNVATPFNASSASTAMSALAGFSSGWTFDTDKSTSANMSVAVPCSVRSLLGGNNGSVLDIYGGEWEFNKFSCYLHNERGNDNGVSIRYGKNLTDLTQEENCASVYTAVMCYYFSDDSGCVYGSKNVTDVFPSRTYDFTKTLIVDVTSEFESAPTTAQLQSKAESYIRSNNVGVPTVSLTVSFVQLGETEEYRNIALIENVELCDTVSVFFEKLGVNAKAKVIKTNFDVLLNRYNSVELGDARYSIADTIAEQQKEINSPTISSQMQRAIDRATQWITGINGGYVQIKKNSDGQATEILITDKLHIDNSTKIWRWNLGGLGYSSDGGNHYETAITQGGEIVADFITAGHLSADLIEGGAIVSRTTAQTPTRLDLDTGKLSFEFNKSGFVGETAIDKDGIVIEDASDRKLVDIGGGLTLAGNSGSVVVLNQGSRAGGLEATQSSSGLNGAMLWLRNGEIILTNANGVQYIIAKINADGTLYSYATNANVANSATNAQHAVSADNGLHRRAVVVLGEPTNGGWVSSAVIPEDLWGNDGFQLADEVNYIRFSVNSSGYAQKTAGSSGSGSIIAQYEL